MNDKMRKVIDEVFEELKAMPREEFLVEFEKHGKGDIYDIMMECGSIEYELKNLIDVESGKPSIIEFHDVEQVKDFIKSCRAGREDGERFKEMFGKNPEDKMFDLIPHIDGCETPEPSLRNILYGYYGKYFSSNELEDVVNNYISSYLKRRKKSGYINI